MSSRRPHHKSHFGCAQCKRRKVKCDEATPACKNCLRRRETCSFLEATLPTPTLINERSPSSRPTSTPTERSSRHLLEIELTHFFLIETMPSLLLSPIRRETWSRRVFPTGLERSETLEAHLLTAAMHKIAITGSSDVRLKYIQFAREMQSTLLSNFIPMLSCPSADTACSLFALSAFTVVWCYASRSLPLELNIIPRLSHNATASERQSGGDGYLADLISIIKISRGIQAVVEQCRHWLVEQGLGSLITGAQATTESVGDACRGLDVLQAWLENHERNSERREVYAMEIERTKRYLAKIEGVVGKESIIGWPVHMPGMFLDDVSKHDPVSLVILAHWGASFYALDDQWWARGWGRGIVQEIEGLVGDAWKSYLGWPLRTIQAENSQTTTVKFDS